MSPSRRPGKEPVLWRCAQWDARRSAGCQAAHRGGEPLRAMRCGGASREARRPSIAPYRHAARRVRTRGTRGVGSRRDASVERATGADHWGRAGAGACGARAEGTRRRGVGARRGSDSKEKPMRVTMRTRVRHSLVCDFRTCEKRLCPRWAYLIGWGKAFIRIYEVSFSQNRFFIFHLLGLSLIHISEPTRPY